MDVLGTCTTRDREAMVGAVISALFALLVFYSPSKDIDLGFITYPANINALVLLISFGVSGIYLAFLLTVIGAIVARARGWVPEGSFRLGRWGVDGVHHRRPLPGLDAGQRRCAHRVDQRPWRALQLRLAYPCSSWSSSRLSGSSSS